MTTEQAAEYLGYGSVEHLEKNDISDRSEWWELIKKLTSKEEPELNLHLVSEMFDFAGYLYGNFDYHDNTKEGDIYIHNDNKLKYTKEKVYKQWIGIRNSR